MTLRRKDRFVAVLLILLCAPIFSACAEVQTRVQARTQDQVVTEYFLEKAGFQKLAVNDTTPKRKAFVTAIPRGKLTAYERGGETQYAYTDAKAQELYVGNETAYQNYLAMTKGRQLCERTEGGSESAKFWSCYDEFQKGGRR